jgi:hypothetical protein
MPVTGTRIEVRNPLPDVRTRGTAVATYLPMGFATPQTAPRWAGHGVTIPTNLCEVPVGRGEPDDICDYTVTARDPNLAIPGSSDCVEFNPFEVYHQLEHWFVQDYTRDELVQYVRDYFALWQSHIIAREALTGGLTSTSPALATEADVVTGLDTSATGALAAVEDGLAARIGNGEGFVHLTPGLFTLLGKSIVDSGDGYRTRTGHRVVVDSGYVGIAAGGGASSAGEATVYGSGPVYLAVTQPRFNGQDAESFVLADNTGVIHVEHAAVLAFEPCTVVAAVASSHS